MAEDFPFYKQLDETDCGAACLRMIARYHGKYYSLEYLRERTHVDRQGVSLLGISDAAQEIGLHTLGVRVDYERMIEDLPLPAIAHWRQSHFVVVFKANKKYVWLGDPAADKVYKITAAEFIDGWTVGKKDGKQIGILLLLEPTPEFHAEETENLERSGWSYVFSYYKNYRKLIIRLFFGLLLATIIQIAFPFIMRAIVDIGIELESTRLIVVLVIAHLILFTTQSMVNAARNWITLYTGTHVNIRMISNYLVRLIDKPISFYETRLTGDILQRIQDHKRIERMLTSSALQTFFSIATFIVFAIVLWYFDIEIFIVFLAASAIYLIWVIYFLKRRKEIDYKRFDEMTFNQSALLQLIHGIKDIKLHNAETLKRWEWERIQAKIYRLNQKYLNLNEWQRTGASFINESKNIIISFLAAKAVIDGDITIGTLVAVQYIIGQLNSPIEQAVSFIQSYQDAKISLQRMNQLNTPEAASSEETINILPENGDLTLEDVSFQYGGPNSPMVLKGVNLRILKGKTTAIVGTSGSGKTTLVKLLLKFYPPTEGLIKLGEIPLTNLDDRTWRDQCGAVLQDGYIFTKTIAKNIGLGDAVISKRRLIYAVKMANVQDFIESLPLGYNTKIGSEGLGLSQGQKQRILLARAIYKNPNYFFFDEATNALDGENEKAIMHNLEEHFQDKTIVTVAHRLSTVKNADQIIVLEKGQIIEQGTHRALIAKGGTYYKLIKNQLELGN